MRRPRSEVLAVALAGGLAIGCAAAPPSDPAPADPFDVHRFGDDSPPLVVSKKAPGPTEDAGAGADASTGSDEAPLVEAPVAVSPQDAKRALIEEIARGAASAPEETLRCEDLPEDQRETCEDELLRQQLIEKLGR